jgi:integrase
VNPCNALKLPAPLVERDRALNDDEILLFWLACNEIGWPFGPLFQLVLLTAQRRDELAQATWSEFDLDSAIWTLPRERTKNDKGHVVQLASAALDILHSLPHIGSADYVFTTNGERPVSGWGRARERLAAAIAELNGGTNIKPFTLHDLRRSAATGMAGLGVAHHVVDKILNHAAGKISGTAAIYNRHSYSDERGAALEGWARHVVGLTRDPPDSVAPMRGA